jgi:glutamyl-Q tRNA(Asp) synthetase
MPESDVVITRFAPSPTGLLHIGHAYSAHLAFEAAMSAGGKFLLRSEDIDTARCRPEFETAILEDLAWLGLSWETPVRRQSEHFDDYRAALARLDEIGVLYPCFCTRAEIAAEIARSPSAPHGPEGPLYPGTCRSLSPEERQRHKESGEAYALRLDVSKAMAGVAGPLTWHDRRAGTVIAQPESLGDVVLARKDVPASYHLASVVDDHLQRVTLIVRGEDLFAATHIHRLLQALLGFAPPDYHHHGLILDAQGKRFAKRDKAVTLKALREGGVKPDELLHRLRPGRTTWTAPGEP